MNLLKQILETKKTEFIEYLKSVPLEISKQWPYTYWATKDMNTYYP